MEYRILKTETDLAGVQHIYYSSYKPLTRSDARSHFYSVVALFVTDSYYKIADINEDSFVVERSYGGSIKFEIVKYE